jgi:hypothetical protein
MTGRHDRESSQEVAHRALDDGTTHYVTVVLR